MKRTGVIIGIVLLFLLACSMIVFVHHSLRVRRMELGMGRMHPSERFMDRTRMKEMRNGMGAGMRARMFHGQEFAMRRGMGPGADMRRDMNRGPVAGMRRGMRPAGRMGAGPVGPGMRLLESVPDVTENQKKEIRDLRQKQQTEMKKLQDDMMARMQALRDSGRKDMLNILTDEQKKFVESRQGRPESVPENKK